MIKISLLCFGKISANKIIESCKDIMLINIWKNLNGKNFSENLKTYQ